MSTKLTRRQVIKAGLAAIGPIALAACAPQATPAPAAAPTAESAAAAATAIPAEAAQAPRLTLWANMIALNRPEGSDPERLAELKDYLLKNAGVDVNAYIPPAGDAAAEKLNLTLGSKSDELDIFSGGWDQYQDAIISINDLLDQYGPAVKKLNADFQTGSLWPTTTDSNGKIWGVPRLAPSLAVTPIWWRTDWLNTFGLTAPQTLDDVEKVMEAFKKNDPDAVMLTNSLRDLRYATVGGFTQYGYSNWLGEDGQIKPPELQADYKDWVAKMAEWYQKGWLFKESFATHDDAEVAKAGHVGMFMGWYSRVTIAIVRILEAVQGMDFAYNPDGITGPKGLMMTCFPGGTSAIMITKKCKDPVAAMKYINWQYENVENVLTVVYGLKGKDWVWDDDLNESYGKQYYVKRLITADTPDAKIYAGEFMSSTGPATDVTYGPSDKQWKRHYEYIRDSGYNFKPAKQRFDWQIFYDMSIINDQVPGLADINRLTDEETIKFITGTRPLSEWDGFLQQLDQAGLKDWSAAYTEQYNKLKQ